MAILRNELKRKYTTIPNCIIENSELKDRSFRILCYLYSRPDNWEINNTDVMDKLGIKDKNSLAQHWQHLIEQGWIERERERDENGKISGGYNYILKDGSTCGETPKAGKPLNREKPTGGKTPPPNNTELYSNTEYNTNTETSIEKENKKEKESPKKMSMKSFSQNETVDVSHSDTQDKEPSYKHSNRKISHFDKDSDHDQGVSTERTQNALKMIKQAGYVKMVQDVLEHVPHHSGLKLFLLDIIKFVDTRLPVKSIPLKKTVIPYSSRKSPLDYLQSPSKEHVTTYCHFLGQYIKYIQRKHQWKGLEINSILVDSAIFNKFIEAKEEFTGIVWDNG